VSTDIAPVFKFSKTLATTTGDLIEAWLAGRNALTRRGYLSDLGQFALWAKAPSYHAVVDSLLRLKPGDANRIVLAYRAHMVESGLSSATINRRLAALRSMVKVGRTIGKIAWSLDVENIKSEVRRDMQGPGLADLQLMTRAAAAMGDRPRARRDRAILAMLFDLGLRRAELCGLDLADVEVSSDGLPMAVWIIGKGHREKERLTVPEATGRALAEWLEARGTEPGPLFHRCDGHELDMAVRLSGESIRLLVRRLGTAAGASRTVRPHGLRHAAATTALDAGKDVREVRKFTRHATLDMVLRYDDQRGDTAGEIAALLSRRRQDSKNKPRRP
jgi:integrase/recombinase XerC